MLHRWAVVAMGCWCAAALIGCGGAREGGPPRLTGTYRLPDHPDKIAVGPTGRVYYVATGGGMMRGGTGELRVAEADSKPGYPLNLAGGVEIKALVADGLGSLYLGVREGGKDAIWVFDEAWTTGTPEPKAKLKPELPGDLNHLFLGREAGTLFALCGDKYVVKLKNDGSVLATVALPGDSRPEDGGVDREGNLYVRRASGPVVKVKPDGTVDRAWAQSAAAAMDSVRSVAVDSRGLVYVAGSEGDVYLRAFDATGALAFNLATEELTYAPDRLVVTPRDVLYALDGQKVCEFRR